MPSYLLLKRNDKSTGTVAVVIFIAGACILVLLIILILIFFKKRHSRNAKSKQSFIPRLERRGQSYGKLEDDEEGAWSADMGGEGGVGKGGYAPVHDESMGYQSQTLQAGSGDRRDGYR